MNARDSWGEARPPAERFVQEVHLDLDDAISAYLRDLVKTGLYGESVEDVCDHLIRRGIERAIAHRLLRLRPHEVRC